MTTDTSPQASLRELLEGQFTPIDESTAARWRVEGWWEERTLRSVLTDTAIRFPERTALVGRRTDGTRVLRTYTELDRGAQHAANVLASLGVGEGDGVVLMLPNWVEYTEILFGINEIGAIYAGIPVAYGERQAAAILRRSKAKVLVIPRRWRSNQHLELSRVLRQELPDLEHVIVLDSDAAGLQDGESLWSQHSDAPPHSLPAPDPNRICYLGFTSGTTGEPKGAMHSHNTLLYSVRQMAEHVGRGACGDPMVQLVASPVGHHTGFAWGVLFTVLLGGTGVYVDRWDAQWGVEVIREEGVTLFFGAPTFVQDLMRTDLAGDPDCPFEFVVVSGAPTPRSLPGRASEAFGAYVAAAWGMTECSVMSSATPLEPAGIQRTDGTVLRGSQVRIVDDHGADLTPGEVGNLIMRGPGVTFGYFDRPDATRDSYSDDLWFSTGDTATLDEHGWLSLRGRSKDIIIRGGENIPVVDIEALILDHPDIVNASVVGVPDARLGERICAVLIVAPGAAEPTVETLAEYLLTLGLSKHYLPERVVAVTEFPMTPSGKIQKFKLQDMLA